MIYEIRNVSKEYVKRTNQFQALSNLNIEISQPGIYGVLGPNGAGKTTLLKIMMKLLSPTSGDVFYQGVNIKKLGKEYLKTIGAVLEGNRNLYWYLTAMQNIEYSGRLMGMKDKDIYRRADPLLETLELDAHRNKKVGYMSRGMQQKVAIISAIVHSPKILFLDEPTLGLDFQSKRTMINEIKKMGEAGATIFLTTHQIDVIEEVTPNLIIIEGGKATYQGSAGQLLKAFTEENVIQISIKYAKQIEEYWNEKNDPNQTICRKDDGMCLITLKNIQQDQLNFVVGELVGRGADILEIAKEEPTLEEVLMKFWRDHNER